MYKLVCQKSAHLSFAPTAVLTSFLQMLIILGMYNFEKSKDDVKIDAKKPRTFLSKNVDIFIHDLKHSLTTVTLCDYLQTTVRI